MHLPVSLLPSHQWTLAVPLVVTHLQNLTSLDLNAILLSQRVRTIHQSQMYLSSLNKTMQYSVHR